MNDFTFETNICQTTYWSSLQMCQFEGKNLSTLNGAS